MARTYVSQESFSALISKVSKINIGQSENPVIALKCWMVVNSQGFPLEIRQVSFLFAFEKEKGELIIHSPFISNRLQAVPIYVIADSA
jgi:hypothetical protein